MFKRINIEGWRQFRKIDVDFHPRLTILTGANGAGKTTLLSLASRHFGWGTNFVSTPKSRGLEASLNYSSDFWMFEEEFESEEKKSELVLVATIQAPRELGPRTKIGEIEYDTGAMSPISVPTDNVGHVYDVQIDFQQVVEGLHIPSHRPTSSYQQVQNIPTVPRRRNDVFQNYLNLIRTRFAGGHTQWSPQYYMGSILIRG